MDLGKVPSLASLSVGINKPLAKSSWMAIRSKVSISIGCAPIFASSSKSLYFSMEPFSKTLPMAWWEPPGSRYPTKNKWQRSKKRRNSHSLMSSFPTCPKVTILGLVNVVDCCRVGKNSESLSLEASFLIPKSCYWMKQQAHWILTPKGSSRKRSTTFPATARPLSLHTSSQLSGMPTTS